MISIVKYETEAEAQQVIAEKTALGLILIELANITEGNFLYFSDSPIPPKTPFEQEVDTLKERDTLMQADITAIIELLGG